MMINMLFAAAEWLCLANAVLLGVAAATDRDPLQVAYAAIALGTAAAVRVFALHIAQHRHSANERRAAMAKVARLEAVIRSLRAQRQELGRGQSIQARPGADSRN